MTTTPNESVDPDDIDETPLTLGPDSDHHDDPAKQSSDSRAGTDETVGGHVGGVAGIA